MQANDPITITLTAREWNVIIEVLHDVPYRVSAPLIASIAGQAKVAEGIAHAGNGAADPDAARPADGSAPSG